MEYRLHVIAVHRVHPQRREAERGRKGDGETRTGRAVFRKAESFLRLRLRAVNSPSPLAKCWFSIKFRDFVPNCQPEYTVLSRYSLPPRFSHSIQRV